MLLNKGSYLNYCIMQLLYSTPIAMEYGT